VALHVYAAATKAYTFRYEPEALFHGGIPTQFNLSPCTQDAVPGQPEGTPQHADHLPRSTGVSRATRHAAVRGDIAARNFPDRSQNVGLHIHRHVR